MCEGQKQVVHVSEKKCANSKRQKVRCWDFENVDKAVCTWFVNRKNQQIPTDGAIFKEEVFEFEKSQGEPEFKAPTC